MGTLICERPNGRRYLNTYQSDGTNVVSAERVFHVESLNSAEGARSILATAGLPSPRDPHPEDPTIVARVGAAVQTTEDSKIWTVTFTYDDELLRFSPDGTPEDPDPTQRPITVSYGFERYQKLAMGGGSYNPNTGEYQTGFLNSALESFDPQPTIDASRPTFTFTHNVQVAPVNAFDWATLEGYQDAVNDATIWGKEKGHLKILSITAGNLQTVKINETNQTVQYRVVEYVIQGNTEGWNLKLLDQGNYTPINPNDPTDQVNVRFEEKEALYYFLDPDGNPVVKRLDGAGAFLPRGQSPKFRELDPTYQEKDFSALGLPNPYTSPPA